MKSHHKESKKTKLPLTLEQALKLKPGTQVVYFPDKGAPRDPNLERGLAYRVQFIELYQCLQRLTEHGRKIAEGQPDSVLLCVDGSSLRTSYQSFYR